MRYEAQPDGSLANGMVFFDMTTAPGEDAIDGVKVDQAGNVYVSGPGGLWVISCTTWRGAMRMAKRCTSARAAACIECG